MTDVYKRQIMDTIIEFDIPQDRSANLIKVIGVGGGGGNAVENMYKQGVCDVSFAAVSYTHLFNE